MSERLEDWRNSRGILFLLERMMIENVVEKIFATISFRYRLIDSQIIFNIMNLHVDILFT